MNPVSNTESKEQLRHLNSDQKKVLKLDHWIKRARKLDLCSPEIKHEASRIKILDTEKYENIVPGIDEYLEDF